MNKEVYMKKRLTWVMGSLVILSLWALPVMAGPEYSKSTWQNTQKPGTWKSGWDNSEKRDVKGSFGRGSDYSSQIGTNPLTIWWSEKEPVFENQY